MSPRSHISLWDERYSQGGAVWGHLPATTAEELWWRLRAKRARRVLVVGCGYGRHVSYFARHGLDATGLDTSRTAIDLAHAAAQSDGLDVVLTCASATRMPFPDGSFDAVYDHATLHHLSAEEREAAVSEYRRVTRAGALLVVSVLSVDDPDFGLGPELEPATYCGADGRREHFFGTDELRGLLDGFEVESLRAVAEPADELDAEPRRYIRAVAVRLDGRALARVAHRRLRRTERLWGRQTRKAG